MGKSVPVATDFIMFQPDNGKPIPDAKTIVKVVYDNDAIYIAALLYDDEPTKIMREISARDDFGASDAFGVLSTVLMTANKIFNFL
jgi:hypothetical protein